MATNKKRISDLPSLESLAANDLIIITSGTNEVSYKTTAATLGTFLVPLISTDILLKGQATLDFGISNVATTTTTVTSIADITATSVVMCALKIEDTPEHSVNTLLANPIRVHVTNVVPGVGFTIYGQMDNGTTNGTYTIQWTAAV
jgi:hypothetical protein